MGEKVDTALYTANGLEVDSRGSAVVNADTLESSVKNVFVIGDGQKGPGTVVEAIAGATKAAKAIQAFDAGHLRGEEREPRLSDAPGQARHPLQRLQEL